MKSLFLAILSASSYIFSYNISPVPNIILRHLNRTKNESSRSAFFGFSLNLRKDHIMIGAPRANSTLENDYDVKEPGQVYKCDFDGNCEEFLMGQEMKSDKRVRSEQFFGFSMDGFENENDDFIACAPKRAVNETVDYRMIGSCFYVKNTRKNYGNDSKVIELLNEPKNYFINLKVSSDMLQTPFYAYGESGFSVHIPNNKKEVLIGSPGVYMYLGTISKFEFSSSAQITGDVRSWDSSQEKILYKESHFGYAITSGQFLIPKNGTIFYVSSAPKRYNGIVIFFEIVEKNGTSYHKIHHYIKGPLMGANFGYALVCDDFNNDGKPDLVVSAPFYGMKKSYDNGKVFLYLNKGGMNLVS